MKKIIKGILILFVFLAISGVSGVLLILRHYRNEIPDIETLVESYTPSVPTQVYDINGKVIDVLYRESRILAEFEEIPESVKDAFLSIEDRRFYSHYGIDPLGLLRAIIINLKAGRTAQGASTFTQQLSRNAFLNHDKKISRKIKELVIAFEIERRYTKDEIFEKYLNEIYFSEGNYGIKSAAKSLFKKDIKDINIAESAMLAGIPNRPEFYNPRKRLENSQARMKVILGQMYKFGKITEEEYNQAMEQKFYLVENVPSDYDPLKTTVIYPKEVINKSIAPDFTDLVINYLLTNFDEETVYNGGLKVYTTLNYDMQVIAKDVFENYKLIKEDPNLQGAMVTIDASNGYVSSIVGGRDFTPGNFNRAFMANRQVGSSFKPFVYLSAIQNGKAENTLVEDTRVLYDRGWAPRNYGVVYRKSITLLEGLNRSINIIAIKLLKGLGYKKFKSTMDSLKMGLNVTPDLSIALGSIETNPLNLAKGYSVFANGGYVVEPLMILEIKDINNATLVKNTPSLEKVFDEKDMALTTNLLINSVRHGTSKPAEVITNRKEKIAQAGKTGTTNDARTVWYAGFTPEYVTTLYLGYDDNSEMPDGTSGGSTASPLWKAYYEELINKGVYTPSRFEYIDNIVATGKLAYQNLDPLSGLLSAHSSARKFLIEDNRLQIEKTGKYHNKNLTDILYK